MKAAFALPCPLEPRFDALPPAPRFADERDDPDDFLAAEPPFFAADFAEDFFAAELTRVLDEFEEATGETPGFFHLNDSQGALGSNRDRHVLLGDGAIGAEPFAWLIADRRSRGVPLVLETPQRNPDAAADDSTPDPDDVAMMELLRRFARNA